MNLRAKGFLYGFASALAQLVLIREGIALFSGNDLSFAVIIGIWLFSSSIGAAFSSVLSPLFNKKAVHIKLVSGTLFIGCVLFLFNGFYLARTGYSVFNIPLGTNPDFLTILKACFLIITPLSFCLGAVLPFYSALFSEKALERKVIFY